MKKTKLKTKKETPSKKEKPVKELKVPKIKKEKKTPKPKKDPNRKIIKRVRLKKEDVFYVNNPAFTAAVVECKKTGVLSPFVIECFKKIAHRAVKRLFYNDELDREDCICSALADMVQYWKNFDVTKSENAFAYFTQMAKNGYAKEYKKIHPHLSKKDMQFETISLNMAGDSSIYTI